MNTTKKTRGAFGLPKPQRSIIGSFAVRTLQQIAKLTRRTKTEGYKLQLKFGFPPSAAYKASWTIDSTKQDSRGNKYHRMQSGMIRRA